MQSGPDGPAWVSGGAQVVTEILEAPEVREDLWGKCPNKACQIVPVSGGVPVRGLL